MPTTGTDIHLESDGSYSRQMRTVGNPAVAGDVAHDAADSGNPIKVGGKAESTTPSAVADGDRVDGWFDLQGRQAVFGAYSKSAVLAADGQVKGGPGVLHSITISCNDAAPTAGSLIVYDALTETGTQVFNHTFTTTPFVPFTVVLDVVMGTGIFAGFTTTADVNIVVAYL